MREKLSGITTPVTFRIKKFPLIAIELLAGEYNTTVAEILRNAVDNYINEKESEIQKLLKNAKQEYNNE